MTINTIRPAATPVLLGSQSANRPQAPILFGSESQQGSTSKPKKTEGLWTQLWKMLTTSMTPAQALSSAIEAKVPKAASQIKPANDFEAPLIARLSHEISTHRSVGAGLLLRGGLATATNVALVQSLCADNQKPLIVANDLLDLSEGADELVNRISLMDHLDAADQAAYEQGSAVIYLGNIRQYTQQSSVYEAITDWLAHPESHPGVTLILDAPVTQEGEVDTSSTLPNGLKVLDFTNPNEEWAGQES